MDAELAYQLTKAHIENVDAIKAIAPFMETLNHGVIDPKVAGLCGPNPVKFHPGAVRAWEEAAHSIPDCAKLQRRSESDGGGGPRPDRPSAS